MLFNFVFALLAVLPTALARPPTTTERCSTKLGFRSVSPVPTSSTSTTATRTRTDHTTVHPTVTSTRPGWTITKLSFCATVTTTISITDRTWRHTRTYTSFTTVTNSITDTLTISTAATITTGDGTSTVPPPSGFTPAGPSGGPPTRPHRAVRDLLPGLLSHQAEEREDLNAQGWFPRPTNPQAVFCTESVKIFSTVTETATAGRTITIHTRGHPTITTSCLTSTSTVLRNHVPFTRRHDTTTTLTQTDTTYLTTTTTVITQTLTTSAAPTATFFAACGPDNALSTLPNRRSISDVNFLSKPFNIFGVSAVSQYDCCVQCITSPICDIAIYNLEYDKCGRAGQCFQINQNGICPQRRPFVQAIHNAECPGTVAVSNGPCGQISF